MSSLKRKGNPFQGELLPGEEILWMDRPVAGRLFTEHDWYLIPMGLVGSGLSGYALLIMFGEPVSVYCILLPLFLISFYMLIGRFFYKVWKKLNMYYAVTNKRLLIVTLLKRYSLVSFGMDSLPILHKTEGWDGVGSIVFDNFPATKAKGAGRIYTINMSNTGLELLGAFGYPQLAGFYDIRDVDNVFHLINEVRYGLAPEEGQVDE